MTDDDRKPEPTEGTDEEGEIALTEDSDTGDRASWIHSGTGKPKGGAGDRPDAREG